MHRFLQDVIGRGIHMIGAYNDLDNAQQVVALIDDVSAHKSLIYCRTFNHLVLLRFYSYLHLQFLSF